VKTGRVVQDFDYGAPKHVGRMVSILAYNFLARKARRLTIDFYAHLKVQMCHGKAALNKKKTMFTSKLKVNLRKKLVNCYIWSSIFLWC
jgi:hypothetical protein